MRRREHQDEPVRRTSAWYRFGKHRPACIFTVGLMLTTMICLIALPTTTRWYNVQALETAIRSAPAWQPIISLDQFDENRQSPNLSSTNDSLIAESLHRVSSWAGHDDLGRSLLLRLMPGFLVSLLVGLVAAGTALVIGTAWGAIAALSGGLIDSLMMRIVDVLYGLPYVLMVILLRVALAQPLHHLWPASTSVINVAVLTLAIGGVSWLTVARVVRGQALSLKERGFIDAAKTSGAGSFYMLRRHLVPNLIGPIAAAAALIVPQAILQESFLSFLGIGIQQPTPSLGRLAADGVEAVNVFVSYWWLLAFPCGVLVLTLLALNFITDGLRDAFDSKSSQSMSN